MKTVRQTSLKGGYSDGCGTAATDGVLPWGRETGLKSEYSRASGNLEPRSR